MRGRLPDSSCASHDPVAASSAALLAAVLTASMASPPEGHSLPVNRQSERQCLALNEGLCKGANK